MARKLDRLPDFDPGRVFDKMAESAFDFLEEAALEVEKRPKFAVIHFATAIELVLKARLLTEHWSLVVAERTEADRRSFWNGSAKTVSVDGAISRLVNVLGVAIPAGALETFRTIAAHRNRMIHFVHNADAGRVDEAERAEVTAELLRGWYHLLRLLKAWRTEFSEFDDRITRTEWTMKRVRPYLEVVYAELRPQLAEMVAKGTAFRDCWSCGFPSGEVDPISDDVSQLNCLICGANNTLVTMPCPNPGCVGTLYLTSYNAGDEECETCETKAEKSDIADFLDTGVANEYGEPSRNCGLCTTGGSVVEHCDGYVCTSCLTFAEEIDTCGWCNDMQLGYDLEDSHFSGCEFCDGRAGWDRD